MIAQKFKPLEQAARIAAKMAMQDNIPQWLRELSPKRRDIHVVLSYAHGGINPKSGLYVTPGKRSINWDGPFSKDISMKNIYYEGEGMRDVVNKNSRFLNLIGIPHTIIGHSWKDWSIEHKCNLINNLGLDIKRSFGSEPHSNSTKKIEDEVQGFEIFTSPGDTPADPMATIQGEEYQKEFPGLKARTGYGTVNETTSDLDKEARFGILVGTDMPYYLDETMFHNEEEYCKKILMEESGRYRIAKARCKAQVRIINELF